jgi:hypothetical protein
LIQQQIAGGQCRSRRKLRPKDLGSGRFSDRKKSSRLAVDVIAFIGWIGSTERRMHELSSDRMQGIQNNLYNAKDESRINKQ